MPIHNEPSQIRVSSDTYQMDKNYRLKGSKTIEGSNGRMYTINTYDELHSKGWQLMQGIKAFLSTVFIVPLFLNPAKVSLLWKQAFSGTAEKVIEVAQEHLKTSSVFDCARNAKNPTQVIEYALRNYDGLIIGELPKDSSPKEFLIDNMKKLRHEGVSTLFLAQFPQSLSDDLERFSRNGKISTGLEQFLKECELRCPLKPSYRELLMAANAEGIAIAAAGDMDQQEMLDRIRYSRNEMQHAGYNHLSFVNKEAAKAINEYKDEHPGKFICLSYMEQVSRFDGLPGLSDHLRCPNFLIERGKNDKFTNRPPEFEALEGPVHFYLRKDFPQKR